MPAIAAEPVSPLVAPRIVMRGGSDEDADTAAFPITTVVLAAALLARRYSNRFPKNCSAQSLNAQVGP